MEMFELFDGSREVKELLAWWNWSDDKVDSFLPLMLSSNIDEFLKTVEGSDAARSGLVLPMSIT